MGELLVGHDVGVKGFAGCGFRLRGMGLDGALNSADRVGWVSGFRPSCISSVRKGTPAEWSRCAPGESGAHGFYVSKHRRVFGKRANVGERQIKFQDLRRRHRTQPSPAVARLTDLIKLHHFIDFG